MHEKEPVSAHEEKLKSLPALSGNRVRMLALEAGFRDAGVTAVPHANEERDAARFEEWIEAGSHGSMRYLERRSEAGELVRARARTPFPWARSAIVCWAPYDSGGPRSIDASEPGTGWIARYAWSSRENADGSRRPSDYHRVLLKRLRALEAKLRHECGEFESRAYVDTGPVRERALAAAAGLGWVGKNTCVIHPELGSFGFLAVLLTSLEIREPARAELAPDRCGSCTRCLHACPTGALTAPRQLDARQCISYLTIEHKGSIEPGLMERMGRQLFGCDICQDVCPWNQRSLRMAQRSAPIAADSELEPRPELQNPPLDWLGSLDESSFERLFNGSPVRRAGFAGLRRNVAVAMGNGGLASFIPRLQQWAGDADAGLRAAARWALGRLRGE